MERAVAVRTAVRVRAEEVAQALDQGGGQAFGPQRVVVGQGGGEAGPGDAEPDGGGYHVAPGLLGVGEVFAEVLVGQQRGQFGVVLVSGADAVEERGPDDAATAPDDGDLAEVEVPVVLLAADGHHVPALGVGDQFGCVQGLLDLVGELGGLGGRGLGAGQAAGRAADGGGG